MECTIDWMPANGMAFSAETGSGHLLTMDGAPDGGGRNLAPRPMETVLAGTGACTRLRRGADPAPRPARRARLPRQGDGRARAAGPEGVHPDPACTSSSPACSSRPSAVERAIALSHEKYCSATIMLGKTAEIVTSYEIVAADAGAPPSRGALRGSARSGS